MSASPGAYPADSGDVIPTQAFDRRFRLAMLAAALVLLTRAALVAQAHNECYDDEYHLVRGARFLEHRLAGMSQTDPPFGEGITALPLVLTNRNPAWTGGLYDHSLPPETTLLLVALWRSILFLPTIAVAFLWCRRVYGLRSAWLAIALLLVEPTFAAHIPLAALDALGVTGAVLGSFAAWRYFEAPTRGRLTAAAAAAALALMLKHTTVILPLVALGYAVLWWGVRPRLQGAASWAAGLDEWRRAWRARLRAAGWGLLMFLGCLWALTLFDVSPPDLPPGWQDPGSLAGRMLARPLPGGVYLGAILHGQWHAEHGHPAYLFGEKSLDGWWYYFPAVAAYKVPIGILAILLMSLLSLRKVRPRFDEWGLLLPLIAWTALMLGTNINIGFRHFLPAYVFVLLLATRCLAERRGVVGEAAAVTGGEAAAASRKATAWSAAAWVAVALAALHALSFHPDYIAYINLPRDRAYMDISDSNVDWGQGLKQARAWIDRHPHPGRTIYLLYFGDANSPLRIQHYLGDRVTVIARRASLPSGGLLIASPVWVAGPFDRTDQYAALRGRRPIDVIGHSMLVYDLDHPEDVWRGAR